MVDNLREALKEYLRIIRPIRVKLKSRYAKTQINPKFYEHISTPGWVVKFDLPNTIQNKVDNDG